MQEAIDQWEGGLQTTGGAIAPEKAGFSQSPLNLITKVQQVIKPLKKLIPPSL